MGYYTKYFSTVFRGLTMTSWKERVEARRLVKALKREDYLLYKKIVKKVEEHKVTSALEDLNAITKELRKSAENAEKLLFNQETVDIQILNAEKDILQALKELSKKTGSNVVPHKLERELALSIYEGTRLAEAQDREEYKQILLIVNEADQHHKQFMEAIRLRFQEEGVQTILARFAIRAEISREKRDIQLLKKIARDIRALIAKIKTMSKKDEEEVRKTLEKDYLQIRDALKDAFYQSYMIKKRDTMMVLKILNNLNNLRNFLIRWAKEHDLPLASVQNLLNEITKLEISIAKEFKPIAQGMRIIIEETQRIEKDISAYM